MKRYNLMRAVGKAKYLISFHDGVTKYSDGSPFYEIRIFKNKAYANKFIEKLIKDGYADETSYTTPNFF